MNLRFILIILNILGISYALPYANYEFHNKNKKGAIMIYIIALFIVFLFSLKFITKH